MSHFSVFPSQGVMGVHSSCSNQSMLLCNMNNFRVHTRKIQSLGKYTGYSTSVSTFSYTSLSLSSLDCYNCCKSQNGSLYNTKVRSQINRNAGINETSSGQSEISDHKKRFSLRLRPRLRLLSNKLKRFQLRSLLKDIGIFIRKNIRSVALSASISVTLGLIFLFLKVTAVPSPKLVPYSELVLNLQKGSVSEVLFQEGSRSVFYNKVAQKASTTQLLDDQLPTEDNASERFDNMELKRDGIETRPTMGMDKVKKALSTTRVWQYSTRKVDHDESFLLSLIREKGTIYSSAPQSPLALVRNALISVLCLWIPTAPILWLFYSRFLNANSLAKKRRPDNQTVTFDDVEGVDAAKTELMEIALCLRGDIDYNRLGAKLPRGVLLSGPPGTGKTLLARAVAGEAGVPFFSVSASEFVEMFVGRGAARVRDLFGTARKNAPSIIFIDELDAVGGKRGRSLNDERDQTLNQLLTEMDGFETDTKVIVIAATNRPDALDPALCRPGRFSRKVIVGEPDEDGRRDILAVHLRGVPLEEDPYLISHLVASLTPGFVGADLANIVNEAALLAVRRGGETVAREDIMEAIERAKFGINNKQPSSSAIKAELGKLLTWMPSLKRRDDTTGPLGYQTLS